MDKVKHLEIKVHGLILDKVKHLEIRVADIGQSEASGD